MGSLMKLLSGGDHYSSKEDAEAGLPKLSDLFTCDVWRLKALLVASFTPQFMYGSTKVRSEDPQQLAPTQNWKKQKPKAKAKAKRKDKNKIEQLLDEFIEQGLDPGKTVVCQLEFPRGRNAIGKWHPRFAEDLKLTLDMVTCKEKLSFVMSGENKVIVSFDGEAAKDPFENVVADEVATLGEESGLVKDMPIGAHFIDLYG